MNKSHLQTILRNEFGGLPEIVASVAQNKIRHSPTISLRRRPERKHLAGILLCIFALAYVAYLHSAQAQCREYCDIDSNTGLGASVLNHLQGAAYNTAVGYFAQQSNQTGDRNTAFGAFTLDLNTAGSENTALGLRALYQNTASENTAVGAFALQSNQTGIHNSGLGFSALSQNDGSENTALGYEALQSNTAGGNNTATGFSALLSNTTGNYNSANGAQALYANTSGSYNTASGYNALVHNTTGGYNTATGEAALGNSTIGGFDSAYGAGALDLNTTGSNNTAIGVNALLHNSSGNNNIGLGVSAGQSLTTGSNNIDIGAPGNAGEANTIRIGKSGTQQKTFIAGISGKTVASGVGVIINSSGQLGTVQSSARFKDDIKPMDKASEALLNLKPVTFRYKEELDPDKIPQFGLIAEEVEKVNPDLVVRDEDGKVMTVRYDAVNAMLLNEFLKQHQKLEKEREEYEARFAEQAKEIASLIAEVKAQRAEAKKLSAQVQLNKPGAQSVADTR